MTIEAEQVTDLGSQYFDRPRPSVKEVSLIMVRDFISRTLDLNLSDNHSATLPLLRHSLDTWARYEVNLLTAELLKGIGTVVGNEFWNKTRREAATVLLETKVIPFERLSEAQLRKHQRTTIRLSRRTGHRFADHVTSGRFQRAGKVLAGYLPS